MMVPFDKTKFLVFQIYDSDYKRLLRIKSSDCFLFLLILFACKLKKFIQLFNVAMACKLNYLTLIV